MRIPTWLLAGDAPVLDRLDLAVWHEVGRRTRDDRVTTVYRTTPMGGVRPPHGATRAEVTCRVCREPVRLRVVDVARARRRRAWGNLLVPVQFPLALALVCAEVVGLTALGVRLGAGPAGVFGWLVLVLPVVLAVLGLAERARRRGHGVTILGPRDARHTLGSAATAVATRT